jgi:hypothetical protein
MPPSPRITFRLPPTLEALVSDRVGQGHSVSDIIREALETYFGLRQTVCPTNGASVSDSTLHMSDSVSAVVSDISAQLSEVVSDVSDMRELLVQLEARLDEISTGVRQGRTSRPTPQALPATPGPSREALADHMQRIAEAREQYERLSLRDFAQLLYDRDIYRTKTGGVVNAGTLSRWLQRAGLQ